MTPQPQRASPLLPSHPPPPSRPVPPPTQTTPPRPPSCVDRFYAVRSSFPSPASPLYVRVRANAYIDVLMGAVAHCGALAGARVEGLVGALTPGLVAALLGASGAVGGVEGGELRVVVEDDGLVLALVVGVEEVESAPVIEDAFRGLFAAVTAWQGVALALAMADVEVWGDDGFESDEEDEEEEGGVVVRGMGRRLRVQCEDALKANMSGGLREMMAADLATIEMNAFAHAQLPVAQRAELLVEVKRRQVMEDIRKAQLDRERKRRGTPEGRKQKKKRFKPAFDDSDDSNMSSGEGEGGGGEDIERRGGHETETGAKVGADKARMSLVLDFEDSAGSKTEHDASFSLAGHAVSDTAEEVIPSAIVSAAEAPPKRMEIDPKVMDNGSHYQRSEVSREVSCPALFNGDSVEAMQVESALPSPDAPASFLREAEPNVSKANDRKKPARKKKKKKGLV